MFYNIVPDDVLNLGGNVALIFLYCHEFQIFNFIVFNSNHFVG